MEILFRLEKDLKEFCVGSALAVLREFGSANVCICNNTKSFPLHIPLKMTAVIFTCNLQLFVLSSSLQYDNYSHALWHNGVIGMAIFYYLYLKESLSVWNMSQKRKIQNWSNIFVTMFLGNTMKYQLLWQHSQIFLFQYFKPNRRLYKHKGESGFFHRKIIIFCTSKWLIPFFSINHCMLLFSVILFPTMWLFMMTNSYNY